MVLSTHPGSAADRADHVHEALWGVRALLFVLNGEASSVRIEKRGDDRTGLWDVADDCWREFSPMEKGRGGSAVSEDSVLERHLPRLAQRAASAKHAAKSIHFASILWEVAQLEKRDVFPRMKTSPDGLSEEEAARRLEEVGPNVVATGDHRGWPWRLFRAVRNPLVILLSALATMFTGGFGIGSFGHVDLFVASGIESARASGSATFLDGHGFV
jgi:hypothetical protein